jgi:protoheme IX farnesyltransferase
MLKIFLVPKTLLSPRDYWKLSKGHLSVWVALSALPGYLVCAPIDLGAVSGILAGTALASASSQALNQLAESDRDSKMARTRNRPLPCGRITREDAYKFALVTAATGSGILTAVSGSIAPATIALSTIALYVRVYTPMKTQSNYNTHVGAIAGSLPVLIGFACAGGFDVFLTSSAPWIFFTLQTLWQFPHFYPLAWMYRDDYRAGGYRMFPLSDESGRETAKMCAPYMAALSVVPFVSSAIGATTWMFPVTGSVINAIWLKQFSAFHANPTKSTARQYFLGSLSYLMLMMGAFVLHVKPMQNEFDWRESVKKRFSKYCIHEAAVNECNVPSLCPTSS